MRVDDPFDNGKPQPRAAVFARTRLVNAIKAVEDFRQVLSGSFIVIRVCDLILFESGEATVLAAFKPVAARVAATLDKEPGRIKIVGHTDNSPMHTVRFPSNFELSVERAKAVAAVLKPDLTDASRIVMEGKGPDAPIASNTTPDGRARNRRVEIFIERSE